MSAEAKSRRWDHQVFLTHPMQIVAAASCPFLDDLEHAYLQLLRMLLFCSCSFAKSTQPGTQEPGEQAVPEDRSIHAMTVDGEQPPWALPSY